MSGSGNFVANSIVFKQLVLKKLNSIQFWEVEKALYRYENKKFRSLEAEMREERKEKDKFRQREREIGDREKRF